MAEALPIVSQDELEEVYAGLEAYLEDPARASREERLNEINARLAELRHRITFVAESYEIPGCEVLIRELELEKQELLSQTT